MHCAIYDEFKMLDITGATAVVVGSKPSGTGFNAPCSVVSNTVVFALADSMTEEAGEVELQVVLTEGQEKVSTNKLTLVVEKEAYNG